MKDAIYEGQYENGYASGYGRLITKKYVYEGNFKVTLGKSFMDGEGTYLSFVKGAKPLSGEWLRN